MSKAIACSVPECGKPVTVKSLALCKMHYTRFWRHGSTAPTRGPEAVKPICSIQGCGKTVKAHGVCVAHYMRLKRHGDPLKGGVPRPTDCRGPRADTGSPLAFAEKTLASCETHCVLWPFAKDRKGYARMHVDGRMVTVSRWVCEQVHGPAPKDKPESCHSCGNGNLGCISPGHLRWGDRLENCNDTVLHGRSNRGEKSPSAKLTEAEVREIRSFYGKKSESEVAALFAISPANAGLIMRRKTWAWLPDLPHILTRCQRPSTRGITGHPRAGVRLPISELHDEELFQRACA